MRVLLIEDDVALCAVLCPMLEAAGLPADACHNGADGLQLLRAGYYDACILDRMLPELDGLAVLRAARRAGVATPVLMLTAMARVGDRVDGLDAGADDYLAKPFDSRELLARLRALIRRPAELTARGAVLCAGDVALDAREMTLAGPKATVTLSRKEFDLLASLCKAPGVLRPREVLLGSVWGALAEVEEANLDSYIHFVRRRLTTVGSTAKIVTVRGAGYRLTLGGKGQSHAGT